MTSCCGRSDGHRDRVGRRLRGAGGAGRVAAAARAPSLCRCASTRSTALSTPTWPEVLGTIFGVRPGPEPAGPTRHGRCWGPGRGRSRPATSSTAPPPSSSTPRGPSARLRPRSGRAGDSASRSGQHAHAARRSAPTRSTTRTGPRWGPPARAPRRAAASGRRDGGPPATRSGIRARWSPTFTGRSSRAASISIPEDARPAGWAHPAPVRGGAARARGRGGGRPREHRARPDPRRRRHRLSTSERRSSSAARRRSAGPSAAYWKPADDGGAPASRSSSAWRSRRRTGRPVRSSLLPDGQRGDPIDPARWPLFADLWIGPYQRLRAGVDVCGGGRRSDRRAISPAARTRRPSGALGEFRVTLPLLVAIALRALRVERPMRGGPCAWRFRLGRGVESPLAPR